MQPNAPRLTRTPTKILDRRLPLYEAFGHITRNVENEQKTARRVEAAYSAGRAIQFDAAKAGSLLETTTKGILKLKSVASRPAGEVETLPKREGASLVEQGRVNASTGIHLDKLGGEALGAVARDGVAVVEVGVFEETESIRRPLSSRVARRPMGAMDSIWAISRLAAPSGSSGALNLQAALPKVSPTSCSGRGLRRLSLRASRAAARSKALRAGLMYSAWPTAEPALRHRSGNRRAEPGQLRPMGGRQL